MAPRIMTIPILTKFLLDRKGAEFVSLVSATRPRMLKKDRYTGEPNRYGSVVKVSRISGLLGFRYENSVNNQREREGGERDFVAEPRRWGQIVTRHDGRPSPLIEHHSEHYLEIKVEYSLGTTYLDEGGTERTFAELAGFLPQRSESPRQELDKPVILRDYALTSIRKLTIGGDTILVFP